MSNTIIRASVAIVKIGLFAFEGLMNEKGAYGVAVPQIVDLGLVPPNRSLKQLESLLGLSFQSHGKWKTKLNPKSVNVLTLLDFEKILRKLDKKGDPIAESICADLIGLSLQQLFSDAFEVEFNERDRQEWLTFRQKSKQAFWNLGDAITEYKTRHSERSDKFRAFVFLNCQDALNRGLFGKSASTIRDELNVTDLLRDHYGQIALRRIDLVQSLAGSIIVHRDVNPLYAVKEALGMYQFDVIDYKE